MRRIYVATSNPGKLRDFAAAAGTELDIAPLPGIGDAPAPAEDAPTFEGNARKKAEHYSRLYPDELVLADDSGLEVNALGGAPGVHSARYAAKSAASNADDAANNARLLREMEGVPDEARRARFVCVLAAARDGQTVLIARGEVEGMILREPRGTNGFGYDPLFYLPEIGKTMAELSAQEKAEVSHRGRALRRLMEAMRKNLDWRAR